MVASPSRRVALASVLALLALTACRPTDSVTDPPDESNFVDLRFMAAVAATTEGLVVEVTAPDISNPFVFNIPVQNGMGQGTIRVSAGADRTFLVRAFDEGGVETHRGSETIDVMVGMNPTLNITLFPLAGEVPIKVTIGSLMVEVLPAVSVLSVGDNLQLTANVTGVNGEPVDIAALGLEMHWGSTNPLIAVADQNGLVTALQGGTVDVVANVGPAAGSAAVEVDPFGFDALLDFMRSPTPSADAMEIKRLLPGNVMPEVVMTVRHVGRGQLIQLADDEGIAEPFMDRIDDQPDVPEESDKVRPGDQMLRVFNTATLQEFEVMAGARLLGTIHEIRERAGLNLGTEQVVAPTEVEGDGANDPRVVVRDARSNGVDSRIIRTPTTAWPWRTISHLSNGCTGTLIGPRHVVTAAHCINQAGTNTWYSFTVRPGRDGDGANMAPFGSSAINPNPAPGDPFRWYFTPSAWRNPGTSNRRQWDWGLIIIPDRLGDVTGWMGYVARPGGTLAAQSNYNRGYPGCGGARPDVPVGCQSRRLYGDLATCAIGPLSFPGSDGWNRLIDHRCDTSGGHSGSSVYHYFPTSGGFVPVVSMIHVASRCDYINNSGVTIFCGPLDFTPSVSRRLTPSSVWIISFFRAWRP